MVLAEFIVLNKAFICLCQVLVAAHGVFFFLVFVCEIFSCGMLSLI